MRRASLFRTRTPFRAPSHALQVRSPGASRQWGQFRMFVEGILDREGIEVGQGLSAVGLPGRAEAEGLVARVLLAGGAEDGLAPGFAQGLHVPDENVVVDSRLAVAEANWVVAPGDVVDDGLVLDHARSRWDDWASSLTWLCGPWQPPCVIYLAVISSRVPAPGGAGYRPGYDRPTGNQPDPGGYAQAPPGRHERAE